MRPLFFVLTILVLASCKGPQFDFRNAYRFSYQDPAIRHPRFKQEALDSVIFSEDLYFPPESPDGAVGGILINEDTDISKRSVEVDKTDTAETNSDIQEQVFWAKDKRGRRVKTKELGQRAFGFSILGLVFAALGFAIPLLFAFGFWISLVAVSWGVKAKKYDKINRRFHDEQGIKVKWNSWPKLGFGVSLGVFVALLTLSMLAVAYAIQMMIQGIT